jgi:phytol kinase
METLYKFAAANIPTLSDVVRYGPPGLLWSFACLWLAAYLKREREWKTGYTRKVFHFLIFFTVVGLNVWSGTRAVCLFGAMASLVIFYAVWRGDGHPLYEAMAREKDAPHRTLYIVVPYCATLLGGLIASSFFGAAAVIGFLVTGLGDAVGEPVGTRFGRHTYRVPSMRGVAAVRSFEGSFAVFCVSSAAVLAGFLLIGGLGFSWQLVLLVPLIGLAAALSEAISPHGWDNATLQVIPAGLAFLVLSHI